MLAFTTLSAVLPLLLASRVSASPIETLWSRGDSLDITPTDACKALIEQEKPPLCLNNAATCSQNPCGKLTQTPGVNVDDPKTVETFSQLVLQALPAATSMDDDFFAKLEAEVNGKVPKPEQAHLQAMDKMIGELHAHNQADPNFQELSRQVSALDETQRKNWFHGLVSAFRAGMTPMRVARAGAFALALGFLAAALATLFTPGAPTNGPAVFGGLTVGSILVLVVLMTATDKRRYHSDGQRVDEIRMDV